MGLSDDQRAMLRLLAQREQGYDDIAALMGISVDEVRAKVKDALTQLESEGVEAPPLPPEPDAPRPPEPVAQPTPSPEPVPGPEPEVAVAAASPAPTTSEAPTPPRKGTASARPKISLPSERGPRAALAAGAAVVVLLIVVVILSGGGSDADTTAGSSGTGTTAEEPDSTQISSKEVTEARLSAVDGSDASGVATFGRIKNSLALQVEAQGLEPTQSGHSYTIWLAQNPQKMLPLASTTVPETGKIGAQVKVPTEVLAYLAKGTFQQMTITETTDSTLKASLAKAASEKRSPVYTGTAVLSGPITGPIVGAADRIKK